MRHAEVLRQAADIARMLQKQIGVYGGAIITGGEATEKPTKRDLNAQVLELDDLGKAEKDQDLLGGFSEAFVAAQKHLQKYRDDNALLRTLQETVARDKRRRMAAARAASKGNRVEQNRSVERTLWRGRADDPRWPGAGGRGVVVVAGATPSRL